MFIGRFPRVGDELVSALSNEDLDAFARVFQSSDWEQVHIRVGDVQLRLSKASAQKTTEPAFGARVPRPAGDPHRLRDTSSEDAPSQSARREVQVFAPHVATFRRSAQRSRARLPIKTV